MMLGRQAELLRRALSRRRMTTNETVRYAMKGDILLESG